MNKERENAFVAFFFMFLGRVVSFILCTFVVGMTAKRYMMYAHVNTDYTGSTCCAPYQRCYYRVSRLQE